VAQLALKQSWRRRRRRPRRVSGPATARGTATPRTWLQKCEPAEMPSEMHFGHCMFADLPQPTVAHFDAMECDFL
jgi:hypothetical protein